MRSDSQAPYNELWTLKRPCCEQARKACQRETEADHAAGRLLRELADVADVAPEEVEAAGDVAVEQERLGERELIVLRPRAGLQPTA